MKPKKFLAAAVAVVALTGPLTACSSPAANGDKEVTVLAAASLTESFRALAKEFEKTHPGTKVTVAFDSSATLAGQAADGAPGDVLATADEKTMRDAGDAGDAAEDPQVFASNTAVVVLPRDNPAKIRKFSDLNRPGVDFLTCVETAPCGSIADDLLRRNKVTASPASRETDVKSVLSKVVEGEADAGIVYVTDAMGAADEVRQVPIPGSAQETTNYPIAVLDQSTDKELAQQFVELVVSDKGRAVLTKAGFSSPES